MAANISTTVPELSTLLPANLKHFCLDTPPTCLTILYGSNDIYKGVINEECIDAFETNLTGTAFCACSLLHWNRNIQAAALMSYNTNKKDLGKKFPSETTKTVSK
jgi:hypothetical protein